VEVLRINDFLAMLVAQRRYYVNNKMAVASDAALQIQSVVYVGGVPQYVALPPDFTDDLAVTAAYCSDGTTTIYSSLFVKKNDSIEKIKKNVTKLQKNKLRNLNKYTT